jgi:hypothetical protein
MSFAGSLSLNEDHSITYFYDENNKKIKVHIQKQDNEQKFFSIYFWKDNDYLYKIPDNIKVVSDKDICVKGDANGIENYFIKMGSNFSIYYSNVEKKYFKQKDDSHFTIFSFENSFKF